MTPEQLIEKWEHVGMLVEMEPEKKFMLANACEVITEHIIDGGDSDLSLTKEVPLLYVLVRHLIKNISGLCDEDVVSIRNKFISFIIKMRDLRPWFIVQEHNEHVELVTVFAYMYVAFYQKTAIGEFLDNCTTEFLEELKQYAIANEMFEVIPEIDAAILKN